MRTTGLSAHAPHPGDEPRVRSTNKLREFVYNLNMERLVRRVSVLVCLPAACGARRRCAEGGIFLYFCLFPAERSNDDGNTMVFAYQGCSRTLVTTAHMRHESDALRCSIFLCVTIVPCTVRAIPFAVSQFLTLDFVLIAPCIHSKGCGITEKV